MSRFLMYVLMCAYTCVNDLNMLLHPWLWPLPDSQCGFVSGPEMGKRKRVSRKAEGKLTLLVNLGGSWHEKLTLLVTQFSLPSLAYPVQGHWIQGSFQPSGGPRVFEFPSVLSCVNTHIHTHTHVYIYIYIHTYTYMYTSLGSQRAITPRLQAKSAGRASQRGRGLRFVDS